MDVIHTISEIAQFTLFPSTLIALIAVWVTLKEINQKQKEKRILEWQRVIIFTIVERDAPIAFDKIRLAYLTEAVGYGIEQLDDQKLQALSVRAALIDLLANKTIVLLSSGAYDVSRGSSFQDQIQQMQAFQVRQSRNHSIMLAELEQHDGKFTEAEWQMRVMQSAQFDEEFKSTFALVMNTLKVHRLITRDSDGKIRLEASGIREIHTVTNRRVGESRIETPGRPKQATFGSPKQPSPPSVQ